jgi:hypothetical protein
LTAQNITAVKLAGLGKHSWDLTYKEAYEGIKVRNQLPQSTIV